MLSSVLDTPGQLMLTLTVEPKHYPECCLSLSHRLFTCLTGFVRKATETSHGQVKILSIGCGTGFLEAALAVHLQEQDLLQARVEAVEVASADTKYLSGELVHRVRGTRDISRGAASADILMFVYPREGELVKQYCTQFADSIHVVLWLGPRADFIAQQDLLHSIDGFNGPLSLEDAGLAPYEIAVAYRSNGPTREKQHVKQHGLFLTKQHEVVSTNKEASIIDVDSL